MLILLGLSDKLWKGNRFAYSLCIAGTAVVSVIYALDKLGLSLGALTLAFRRLPLYNDGFGWFCAAVLILLVSALLNAAVPVKKKRKMLRIINGAFSKTQSNITPASLQVFSVYSSQMEA